MLGPDILGIIRKEADNKKYRNNNNSKNKRITYDRHYRIGLWNLILVISAHKQLPPYRP